LLDSWLDRLLVLLVVTTAVLTLLALRYVGPATTPPVASAAAQPPSAPAPEAAPGSAPAASASDPGDRFAQTGLNALQAGDAAAAVRWFERATQTSPENPRWRRGLADAYRASGDAQRAGEEELRAQELEAELAPAPIPASD
jgi:cytochrome c-type biogenesis protein CcmH/NrfG